MTHIQDGQKEPKDNGTLQSYNIFNMNDQNYFITGDYVSGYFEVERLT